MVGVEGQVFPVFLFLFFLFSVHLVFFVCAYMYVNFIECHSVGHCMFCVSAVFCSQRVIVTNHETIRRVTSQSYIRLKEFQASSLNLKLLSAGTYCVWITAFKQHYMMYSKTAHSSFQG